MALENVMRVDNGNVIDGTMPQTYTASRVMMSDGETSVEDAVDEVAGEIEKIIVQNGTVSVTGVSDNWVYMNITFNKPFKKQPLVAVNQFDTGTANTWYPPILKNVTVNGFTAGWYRASGTKEIIWQAVGVVKEGSL